MNFRSIPIHFLLTIFFFNASAQNAINKDSIVVTTNDSTDIAGVFKKVEFEASFPGGNSAWIKFLQTNLRGDVPAENGAPAGHYTVWVQFVVDKNGNVSNVTPLTKNGYGMEEEVVRIINKGPQWQPAIQNGRPVKAYRKQPITFVIEIDGFEIITEDPDVLYTGIDNPVSIKISGKHQKLTATISQGSIISKGDDNYIVQVTRVGRAIIELFDKKQKSVAAFSLEVRKKGQSTIPPVITNSASPTRLDDDEDKIFEKSEIEAAFPGGEAAWKKFLEKNLKGDVATEHGAPAGSYTVWLQFIVDKEGNVSDVRALTNLGYGMEEECLRLMKQSPKWVPAMQNGRVVKAYKRQPITFVIETK